MNKKSLSVTLIFIFIVNFTNVSKSDGLYNELTDSISEIQNEIKQLDKSDIEDAIIIDEAINEIDTTLHFVVESLATGNKEVAILALEFIDQSLSGISSIVPNEVFSDMSDADLTTFSDEDLIEIQNITKEMDTKKLEDNLELINKMISMKENGLDEIFVTSKNLNLLGVLDLGINVNMINVEEMQSWTKEDWANSYIGNDPTDVLTKAGFSVEEIKTEKARLALENAKMHGFELKSNETNLDFDTDFDAYTIQKGIGTNQIDISAHTFKEYTTHRQHGKEWVAALYDDGSTRILANEEELQKAANEFSIIQQKNTLNKQIMRNVSKEQAKDMLAAIESGENISALAEQIENKPYAINETFESVSELLENTKDSEVIFKETLETIADPEFIGMGVHRQFLKDWETKLYSDGSFEIIASAEELEQAAAEFSKDEQLRSLSNAIRDSMSQNDARLLLKNINEGKDVSSDLLSVLSEGMDGPSDQQLLEGLGSFKEDLAKAVSDSLSSESVEAISDSASEVANNVSSNLDEISTEIASKIDVEDLTEALEKVVGNATGEITAVSQNTHYWADKGGWGFAVNFSDGSMVFCNTGESYTQEQVDKVKNTGEC